MNEIKLVLPVFFCLIQLCFSGCFSFSYFARMYPKIGFFVTLVLLQAFRLLMDGTFKICSGLDYQQLLIICVLVSKENEDGSGHGQLYCLPVAYFYLSVSSSTFVRFSCVKFLTR